MFFHKFVCLLFFLFINFDLYSWPPTDEFREDVRQIVVDIPDFNPELYNTLGKQKKFPDFKQLKSLWRDSGIRNAKEFHQLLVEIHREVVKAEIEKPLQAKIKVMKGRISELRGKLREDVRGIKRGIRLQSETIESTLEEEGGLEILEEAGTLDELEALIEKLEKRLAELKASVNKIWTKELLNLLDSGQKKIFEKIVIPVGGNKDTEEYIAGFTDAYVLDITTKEFLYKKHQINKHISKVTPKEWRQLRRKYLKELFKEQIQGMFDLRNEFERKPWSVNLVNDFNLLTPLDLLIKKMVANEAGAKLFIKLLIKALTLRHSSIYSWLDFKITVNGQTKTSFKFILDGINKDEELKQKEKIEIFEAIFKSIELEAGKLKKAVKNKEERLEQETAVRDLKKLYQWALMLEIKPQVGGKVKQGNVTSVRNCLLKNKEILDKHNEYFGKVEAVVFEPERYTPPPRQGGGTPPPPPGEAPTFR